MDDSFELWGLDSGECCLPYLPSVHKQVLGWVVARQAGQSGGIPASRGGAAASFLCWVTPLAGICEIANHGRSSVCVLFG